MNKDKGEHVECSPFIMELHRGSGMSETLLVIISILLFLMLLLIVFLSLHFYKNEHTILF